jgi:hypothetical protein
MDDKARKVFQVLKQDAASGYSVMKKTGLNADDLVGALQSLMNHSLVMIKGELNKERVGEAYLAVNPSRLDYAEFLMRS